jgi:GAF domain-containing protein
MSHPPESGLAAAYGELLGLLSNGAHLDAFLDRVVAVATGVVSPPASCGLTVRRDGQPFTVVSSDDFAAQVDEIQYGADQGPCLDSLRTGVVVQVDDLSRDERWGDYRAHAVAHGVVSSLSLPLVIEGETVAALNLYSNLAGAFCGPARQYAEAFAAQSAAALALAQRHINHTH